MNTEKAEQSTGNIKSLLPTRKIGKTGSNQVLTIGQIADPRGKHVVGYVHFEEQSLSARHVDIFLNILYWSD